MDGAGAVPSAPGASPSRRAKGVTVEDGPNGEWVRGKGVEPNAESAILYLHGSGYVVCSPNTHRGLVARLTR